MSPKESAAPKAETALAAEQLATPVFKILRDLRRRFKNAQEIAYGRIITTQFFTAIFSERVEDLGNNAVRHHATLLKRSSPTGEDWEQINVYLAVTESKTDGTVSVSAGRLRFAQMKTEHGAVFNDSRQALIGTRKTVKTLPRTS